MAAAESPTLRRILLVEDHVDSAIVFAKLLRSNSREVLIAHTLAEAKRLCKENTFDVVLCDIGLPDGSGLELAPILKADCPGTRIIALTAYGMPREVAGIIEAGFDAHLLKPIELRTLLAEVEKP